MISAIKRLPMIYFLVISLGLPLVLIGCATSKIVLHPLSEADIYDGKNKGDICFSEYYLDKVLEAKLDRSK